jgi:hypothetical protein
MCNYLEDQDQNRDCFDEPILIVSEHPDKIQYGRKAKETSEQFQRFGWLRPFLSVDSKKKEREIVRRRCECCDNKREALSRGQRKRLRAYRV